MPLFYFHLHQGSNIAFDEDGWEFLDLKAAVDEAELSARDLATEAVRLGTDSEERISIADENGQELASVTIKSVSPSSRLH